MTPEDRFNEHYKEGSAPWDIGKPDFNLIQTVTTTPIAPCKALEIGCGTGDNAIWLSQQNFTVIGVDISEIAIEKAREKAAKANVTCAFAVLNFLKSHVEGAPFVFAFDRGCFHTVDSPQERQAFALQVNRPLGEEGILVSFIGSADDKFIEAPQKLTAKDFVGAVNPYLKFFSLFPSRFETHLPVPPRA